MELRTEDRVSRSRPKAHVSSSVVNIAAAACVLVFSGFAQLSASGKLLHVCVCVCVRV